MRLDRACLPVGLPVGGPPPALNVDREPHQAWAAGPALGLPATRSQAAGSAPGTKTQVPELQRHAPEWLPTGRLKFGTSRKRAARLTQPVRASIEALERTHRHDSVGLRGVERRPDLRTRVPLTTEHAADRHEQRVAHFLLGDEAVSASAEGLLGAVEGIVNAEHEDRQSRMVRANILHQDEAIVVAQLTDQPLPHRVARPPSPRAAPSTWRPPRRP